ncbi:MAG TPA: methyltransferase domain-containing protein [Limnochordia bacterium]
MGVGRGLLWRAFGLPTGVLGRLGGRIMAGGKKEALVQKVLALLDVRPGERVLEVGFGPGVGIRLAQARVGQSGLVVGVDPSDVMIEMAQERNAEAIERGTVKLLKGTVDRLPFPEDHFDKAYAMNSMQVWPDATGGLREIRRVLKQGGRLALSFDGPARKVVTRESVAAALAEAGYKEVETHDEAGTLYLVAAT